MNWIKITEDHKPPLNHHCLLWDRHRGQFVCGKYNGRKYTSFTFSLKASNVSHYSLVTPPEGEHGKVDLETIFTVKDSQDNTFLGAR